MLSNTLVEQMAKHGPTLHNHSTPQRIEKLADGTLVVHLTNGKTIGPVEKLVWAIGREPATDNINLAAAGVELDEMFSLNKLNILILLSARLQENKQQKVKSLKYKF